MDEETALIQIETPSLVPFDDMAMAGEVADAYARENVFDEYHQKCTINTLRRQKADLRVFAIYLQAAGVQRTAEDLQTRADSWAGITYGLLKGFIKWQLDQGYAIGSINVRLASVRKFCTLAFQSGELSADAYDLIKTVKGYSDANGIEVDKKRDQTRKSSKKAAPVSLNLVHAVQLKKRDTGTLQGYKDSLLMCLLLDHGLRCGEIASLTARSIDITEGTITFYREKVKMIQTHRLTSDALMAAIKYLQFISPDGPLFYGYKGKPMSSRAINDRVGTLGADVNLSGLSPHDCRHYWATAASRNKTPIKALQTAGGWKSPAMPLRYAEAATIANDGVILE